MDIWLPAPKLLEDQTPLKSDIFNARSLEYPPDLGSTLNFVTFMRHKFFRNL